MCVGVKGLINIYEVLSWLLSPKKIAFHNPCSLLLYAPTGNVISLKIWRKHLVYYCSPWGWSFSPQGQKWSQHFWYHLHRLCGRSSCSALYDGDTLSVPHVLSRTAHGWDARLQYRPPCEDLCVFYEATFWCANVKWHLHKNCVIACKRERRNGREEMRM